MKFIITFYEEYKSGKLILPQIQCVITANSIAEAKQFACEKYKEYHKISVYEYDNV